MKIAIPVFHTKISPRFDQARAFVFIETNGSEVISKQNRITKDWSLLKKRKQLVDQGIEVLICGGIDRDSLQYLGMNGIQIYSWVTGDANHALACFFKNSMRPGLIVGKNGMMKGRWQFCKGINHLSNIFCKHRYNPEKEVTLMPRGDGTGPKGEGPRSGKGRGGCRTGRKGRGTGRERGQEFKGREDEKEKDPRKNNNS